MQDKLLPAVLLAGSLISGPVAAEGFGLGVKAGTLGLGVEGSFGLSERISLRVGVNSYSYSYDETASDIRYDAELDLQSGALLLDWHPFAGTFRLSAGLIHNKNAVHLNATTMAGADIGGSPVPAGTNVRGDVTFKKNVPYAGIGWGNAARGKGLGASVEIGAMFQDRPEVTLTATGVPDDDLRREEEEVEADLDNFELYPVISFGLSYRF